MNYLRKITSSIFGRSAKIVPINMGNDILPEKTCSICYDNLCPNSTKYVITNCNHEYHLACLREAIAHKPKCPICRAEITHYTNNNKIEIIQPASEIPVMNSYRKPKLTDYVNSAFRKSSVWLEYKVIEYLQKTNFGVCEKITERVFKHSKIFSFILLIFTIFFYIIYMYISFIVLIIHMLLYFTIYTIASIIDSMR